MRVISKTMIFNEISLMPLAKSYFFIKDMNVDSKTIIWGSMARHWPWQHQKSFWNRMWWKLKSHNSVCMYLLWHFKCCGSVSATRGGSRQGRRRSSILGPVSPFQTASWNHLLLTPPTMFNDLKRVFIANILKCS